MVERFLRRYLKIDNKNLLDEVVRISTVEYFPKNEKLTRVGDRQKDVFLLMDGIVRGYLTDLEGREFTDCFGFLPGTPAMGCTKFDLPAQLNIQALSDIAVLRISVEDVMELVERYPEVAGIYNRYLMWSLEEHFEHDMIKSTMSAGERYGWFVKKYPDLLDKVSHRYIASFLNMVPQTLSKERTKLRKDCENDFSETCT